MGFDDLSSCDLGGNRDDEVRDNRNKTCACPFVHRSSLLCLMCEMFFVFVCFVVAL